MSHLKHGLRVPTFEILRIQLVRQGEVLWVQM